MNSCPRCRRSYPDGVRFCPDDGAAVTTVVDPYIGRVLMGQFRLLSVAGRGAMGTVYRAEQARMDRIVAVKVLRRDLLRDELAGQRFLREAMAAARLSHPHIVTVHLVGETDEGVPFLVMEYVEGRSLGQILEAEKVLDTRRALGLARQIASALALAHARGIVHRDLKADNILVSEGGPGRHGDAEIVKVLDFGIAKLLSGEGGEIAQLTRDGTIFGTPHYIAPEQASGKDVDGRADIYSLGVILFRALTGRLPFDGNSGMQVLMRHVRELPPRPRAIRPEISDAVQALILRALEKDRDQRYANATALIAAIDAVEASLDAPVDASKTWMGVPAAPRSLEESRSRGNSARVGAPAAARESQPAAVGPTPPVATAADPSSTLAGEVGLAEWSQSSSSTSGTDTGDPLWADEVAPVRSRRAIALVGGVVAVVALGAAARVALQWRSQPDAPAALGVVDRGAPVAPVPAIPPRVRPPLAGEQVASVAQYAVRIGFEFPPLAGEPNVVHVYVEDAHGAAPPDARANLAIRSAGEREDRVPLRADGEGFAAGLLFRAPGPHQLRVGIEREGAGRAALSFEVSVGRAAGVTGMVGAPAGRPLRSRRGWPRGRGAAELPMTVIGPETPAATTGAPADTTPRALGPASPPPTPTPLGEAP